MDTFFTLFVLVGAFGTFYFIKKQPNKKKRNISIGILVVGFLGVGIFADNSKSASEKKDKKDKITQTTKGKEKTTVSSTEKSEPIKEETNDTKKSDEEYNTEFDNEIKKYIEENTGFALGTLDHDGNPTENGTPNPDFKNWVYVKDVKITTSKQIEVNATEDFRTLPKNEKDSLASSIQGMVIAFTQAQSASDRYHIYFYNGENAMGGSKVLQSNDYKWYK